MEEKKISPILIVILSVLGTCLVGFGIWQGVKKFNNKGDLPNSTEQSTNESDKTNSIHETVKENNSISKDKVDLYNKLMSNNGGFYFEKSVYIDSITPSEFLEYALGMYMEEKNIIVSDPDALGCVEDDDHYGDCSKAVLTSVSKEALDDYIKNKFNTNREFTLSKGVYDGVEYPTTSGYVSSLDASDLGDYVYKFDNKTYYLGRGARGGGDEHIHTKLLDVKEENNNIYFYDKAIYCFWGPGDACWSSVNQEFFDSALFELDEIYSGKKYEEVSLDNNNDVILNEDYVFEKYLDKLNTYKHTFKKVDGKYYWVSSEIVK